MLGLAIGSLAAGLIGTYLTNKSNESINDKNQNISDSQFEKQLLFNDKWNTINHESTEKWNEQSQANFDKNYAQTEKWNEQSQANWLKQFEQEQANYDRNFAQNESQFNQNMALQKDVAYNGLGMRIADAERNGISKWAVAGDSSSAGVVGGSSVGNISASSASFGSGSGSASFGHAPSIGAPSYSTPSKLPMSYKIDLLGSLLQLKQMEIQTKMADADLSAKKYALEYADSHKLPIGSAPNVESSLLGLFNTDENRGKVLDKLSALEKKYPSLRDVKKHIPGTSEYKRDRYENKVTRGGEKAAKEQSYKDRSGNKARDRRFHAQSRNAGALPAGSIPNYIYRRSY